MSDLIKLEALIRDMADASGKILKGTRLEFYMRKLRQHIGPALFALLEDLAEEAEFPSPKKIKAQLNARLLRNRQQQGPAEFPQPTPEELKRADRAAVLSLLWLHYEKGWPIGGREIALLARRYQAQTGNDPAEAIERAKAEFTPEFVRWWMEQHTEHLSEQTVTRLNSLNEGAPMPGHVTPHNAVKSNPEKSKDSWASLLGDEDLGL